MQNEQERTADEIGLNDVMVFLKSNRRSIVLGGFIGLSFAIAYIGLTPNKYEARWQVQMAKFVNNGNVSANSNGTNSISFSLSEDPAALIQRLRVPTVYSPAVRQSCGVNEGSDPGEDLGGRLKVNLIKNVNDSVEMKVVSSSRDQAMKCAEALTGMIVEQQRDLIVERLAGRQTQLAEYRKALLVEQQQLEKLRNSELGNFGYLAKLDQVSWLRTRIDGLQEEAMLSQLHPARLTTPIYVPSGAVSPAVGMSLVLGALLGLMFGLIFALAREVWRKMA